VRVKTDAVLIKQFFSAKDATEPAEFPAFTPVLSGCVHFLHKLPPARSITAGALLVEQGCAAGTVQLIAAGLVKLLHVNSSGREVTLGLRSEGWYSGYMSAFLKAPSAYSVRAITPCRVVEIPAADFPRCVAQNSEMLSHFLAVMCAEVASQTSLHVEVMSSSATDRLDRFMRERLTNHPLRRTFDPLPVLKQLELAQLLAVTPEHLSRLLRKRQKASQRMREASAHRNMTTPTQA